MLIFAPYEKMVSLSFFSGVWYGNRREKPNVQLGNSENYEIQYTCHRCGQSLGGRFRKVSHGDVSGRAICPELPHRSAFARLWQEDYRLPCGKLRQ